MSRLQTSPGLPVQSCCWLAWKGYPGFHTGQPVPDPLLGSRNLVETLWLEEGAGMNLGLAERIISITCT